LNDKLIINSLARLAHRPHENHWMFFSHLEELFHVLDENYASYRINQIALLNSLKEDIPKML
jgi:hypothetical protein